MSSPASPSALPLAVVVGTDADSVARVAQAAESAGARAAVFVGEISSEQDRTALLALLTELA